MWVRISSDILDLCPAEALLPRSGLRTGGQELGPECARRLGCSRKRPSEARRRHIRQKWTVNEQLNGEGQKGRAGESAREADGQ